MNKRNPKAVYWTVYLVTLLFLSIAFALALILADHWFFAGKRQLGGYGGTMAVPLVVLAGVIATRFCRRLGISLEHSAVESIKRGSVPAPSGALAEFEMRWPRGNWLALGSASILFSLLILLAVCVLPAVPGTEIYGFMTAAGFGVAGLGCLIAYITKFGFIARADDQGVKGYHGFSLRTKAVRWSEIQSCEVTIIRDALGRLAHPFFEFKGEGGTVLLKMRTVGTPVEQTQKFKGVIEHRLSIA